MIQVKFRKMEKSEFVRLIVTKRVEDFLEKFDELKESEITVTLEMENSPLKAGPDLFKVSLHVFKGRFAGTRVVKSDANLYIAVADLMDHMLEKINRAGDKERVRKISTARKLARAISFQKSS